MTDKNTLPKVDVIVPCYNEEDRVSNVLKTLLNSKFISQVICVDDASRDNSAQAIRKIEGVKLVCLSKNKGKGNAVRQGIKFVKTKSVMLCDADLSGLDEENIKSLVEKHFKNPDSLVVGLKENNHSKVTYYIRENILPLVAGERIMPTVDLKKILSFGYSEKYGLEPFINYYFKFNRKKIFKIKLRGVSDPPKYKKENYGLKPYFAEGVNQFQKYLEIYGAKFPKDTKDLIIKEKLFLTLAEKMYRSKLNKPVRIIKNKFLD